MSGRLKQFARLLLNARERHVTVTRLGSASTPPLIKERGYREGVFPLRNAEGLTYAEAKAKRLAEEVERLQRP